MKKKYAFTGKVRKFNGTEVHQIVRLSDGLVGGWIQSEHNLSHLGKCFVYNNSIVVGSARIIENAKIFNDSIIIGVCIAGDTIVRYKSLISKDDNHTNVRISHSIIYDCRLTRLKYDIHYSKLVNSIITGNPYIKHSIIKDSFLTEGDYVRANVSNMQISEDCYINFDTEKCPFMTMYMPYANNGRIVTYFREDGVIKANIGCQNKIDLETFRKRIFKDECFEFICNEESLPKHRQNYLKQIEIIDKLI